MQNENIITNIEPLNKSRFKIYIDGEPCFILYRSEKYLYNVEKGSSILPETMEKIFSETLLKRAKLRSMNLLTGRDYTEAQLREKLGQGLYPETVVEEAIAYVKSFHYIDDRRYVKNYIVYYGESRSRGRIEQDLLKRGIDRELIREVYEEDLGEEKLPEEKQLIEKLLNKRHYDRESADYKTKQKTAAFLYRKGFSMDQIREML